MSDNEHDAPVWTPYDNEAKGASPLPATSGGFDRWSELVWVFDAYYEGVTLARWTQNGDDPERGWWVGIAHKDDIGVTHWMPLERPAPPVHNEDGGARQ